jgi:hypothetical protein
MQRMQSDFSATNCANMQSTVRRILLRVLLVFFWSHVAFAEPKRVLLISGGSSFEDALRIALSPWNLAVKRVEASAPTPSMPSAVEAAQVLAMQYQALGVVWISSDATGHALWVYDADTQQVVTRSVPRPPPFDPPSAAAAALTVKSLFRASTVAPIEERLGAEAVRETPQFSPPAPRPSEQTVPEAASIQSAKPMPSLALELGVGPRFLDAGTDLRIAAGAALRATARATLLLETRAGPGLGIEHPLFSGRFVDVTIPLWVRYSFPLSERFSLSPQVGPALDVSWLSGLARGAQQGVSKVRADGLFNVGLLVEVAATQSLRFALEGLISYRLRYQRYLVNDQPIFALQPFEPSLALRVSGGIL